MDEEYLSLTSPNKECYNKALDVYNNILNNGDKYDLCIMCSELSALCNRNKYIPIKKARIEHIRRYEMPNIMYESKNVNLVKETQQKILDDITFGNSYDKEDKNKIKSIVDSVSLTRSEKIKITKSIPALRGISKEEYVYKVLKSDGYDIRDIQQGYITYVNVNKFTVKIYGKVDGIMYADDIPTAVVEIKNRVNHFFEKTPDHELDQLVCYMVLSKLDIGYIIECYDGKLKYHKYTLDQLLIRWSNMLICKNFELTVKHIMYIKNNPKSSRAKKAMYGTK